jgi:cytochrome c oxidase subunit 2
VLAAGSLALLAACDKRAPSALDPHGDNARHIASAWWLMFSMAIVVYAIVAGLIIFGLVRGRGTDAGKPTGVTDGAFIWIGGIAIPTAVLAVLAVVTVTTTNTLRTADRTAMHVSAIGHDWWWEVRYPDRHIVTANEIHIPTGTPVRFDLTTDDVIHSFWVPQLAGKIDMIPGQHNVLQLTAEKPGRYRGACAEFCGLQHANMTFVVVAQTPGDFERWAARESISHTEPVSQQAEDGRAVFERNACAGCHTIAGTSAVGIRGPNLSDLGQRSTIAAGTLPNDKEHLAEWITDPQSAKPGALMPPTTLSQRDLDALIEYLESQR